MENNVIKLRDDRKLGYAQYGDPKGKPLFFFHGWPSSRFHGGVTDEAAKKLKIKVISIDRPRIGLSDDKPSRTLLDFPDDVIELADKLRIKKFAVMGVSGGGPYAASCAFKIPERITKAGIVVGLAPTYIPGILEGTSTLAKFGWSNYGKYPLARTVGALLQYLNAKYGPSLGFHRFMFGSKADRKLYGNSKLRKETREGTKEAFRQGYKGAEQDLKLYTTPWEFNLKDIKAKVYLWYGEDDKNVSLAMGEYYASQIPGSKLTIYPNEGHLATRTHIEEILKTLTS